MRYEVESLRQTVDRICGDHARGYVPSYLLRLVAMSLMVGALAFEAMYRFGDVFGHLSVLLIVVSVFGFAFGAFFVALFIAYQFSERRGATITRIHDRSW